MRTDTRPDSGTGQRPGVDQMVGTGGFVVQVVT